MPVAASRPFVTELRSRPGTVRLGTGTEPVITVRVQMPEVWDTVRVEAPADTAVATLKHRALELLVPDAAHPEDYVTKLRGFEVLDESQSLAAAGARDGSIFLVHGRRRRPVR
ncbi:MAG TPA: EsaB/YukD family protein [Gemmatimonadaceae bacterium]|nr:EsaB/YukD family protein [Gemmatimonadaceae bacterium]